MNVNANQIEISSLLETQQLAAIAANLLRSKTALVCLDGELGAGKTTFTQAFGKALGVKRTINSPTFTIMKSYKQADGAPLHHIDAYRLEGMHQDLGFEECFDEGITVIEWGQFIADIIDQPDLSLSFENQAGQNRLITVGGKEEIVKALLQEVAAQ
jgi:tRNA threonylcarbamoyladenosine biosynthesis protein TsaE